MRQVFKKVSVRQKIGISNPSPPRLMFNLTESCLPTISERRVVASDGASMYEIYHISAECGVI
jgi:hypothetical protein